MFTVAMTAYTATAMVMAISADQNVVAIANIYMTITFVFMMVRAHVPHPRIVLGYSHLCVRV